MENISKKKPNLLFIFADQWRRNSVGFMEKENVITPNLDSFSKDSVVFENAFSTCPLCSPSRATMLTGKYPISHEVLTNCKPGLEGNFLKEEEVTIGDILKKEKYATGYIGKWHLDRPESETGLYPESEAKEWDAYTPPKKRHGFDFWYSYGADDNHLTPHYWSGDNSKQIKINKWSVEHETDIALQFLEKNKNENFALFVSWNPPHTPLDQLPQKYIDMYKDIPIDIRKNVRLKGIVDHPKTIEPFDVDEEKYIDMVRKYYGAITGVDENFGRIIEYLKENNLYEDTIIVVTADHGEMLCSHGLWSKHVWYEESTSVPFIVSYGDKIKGRTSTVLSGVDIVPTLLSLMKVETDVEFEGKDLKEALYGEKIKNTAITMCYPGNAKLLRELKEKNIPYDKLGWRSISDEKYTYVAYRNYNGKGDLEEYVYSRENDEFQLKPFAPNEETKYLKEELEKWAEKFDDKIFIK